MRILFAGAEAAPLAKLGGLGDVVGSLPKALNKLGHDVRIIIPSYGCIDFNQRSLSYIKNNFTVPAMGKTELASLKLTYIKNDVPVYLVENKAYFGGEEVYTGTDMERFLFFSRSIVEVLPQLDWQPDIIHCHDWHTALTVMWLKRFRYPQAALFTIHNLAYQGQFDEWFMGQAQLRQDWSYPADAHKPPLTFMSQGILWADLVTTVSETYAKEIMTPEYGGGLESLLRYRQQDLLGIVNGIDYDEYNPATDRYLPVGYTAATISRRFANKLALQKRMKLPQDNEVPLIGMVQRLDEQKGFDIFEKAADSIINETEAQIVILGNGRENYHQILKDIAERHPQRISVSFAFDDPLAHLIYGGSDIFLMPSRFEPCGLGQLIAMRYGAIPVVRQTGGLADTVPPFSPNLETGNGFVFREYAPQNLLAAVKAATAVFTDKDTWSRAVQRLMKLDFSWEASAVKYQSAYRRAMEKHPLFPR